MTKTLAKSTSDKIWRESHKQEIKTANHEWYVKNREKSLAACQLWQSNNRERVNEISRQHDQRNVDARRLTKKLASRQWRIEHAELNRSRSMKSITARNAKRRAIKKAAVIGDQKPVAILYAQAQGKMKIACFYCGKKTNKGQRHIDHKTPLSREGKHCIDNLCVACVSCNLSKKDKTAEEFICG